MFWGLYADRFGKRHFILRTCYLFAIASFSLLAWFESFPLISLVLVLYTFFLVPVLPLWEATVLEKLGEFKNHYGQTRLWGSLGFIVFSMAMGVILDDFPSTIIITAIIVISVLNLWQSYSMKVHPESLMPVSRESLAWMRSPRMILFLTCCAMMHFTHTTYYSFFSIFMRDTGHSNLYIGFLWTLGVLFEVWVMARAGYWIQKWGHERLFTLSLLAAVFRWSLSAVISGGPWFIALQSLHGLTFGLFHVCAVTWVARVVPQGFQGTAQSLFSSATYGVGGIIGFLLNGILYDAWGASRLWRLDAWVALGAFLLSFAFYFGKKFKESAKI